MSLLQPLARENQSTQFHLKTSIPNSHLFSLPIKAKSCPLLPSICQLPSTLHSNSAKKITNADKE